MKTLFRDRRDAGRQLAAHLGAYTDRDDVLVLAFPGGGMPVAFEVAQVLNAPLDVFMVRTIGAPGYESLTLGIVATGDVMLIDHELVSALDIFSADLDGQVQKERQELYRHDRAYRDSRPAAEINGRTAILVDDGLASGATIRAAVAALRRQKPARLVLAAPSLSSAACNKLKAEVDEFVCVVPPGPFNVLGLWYTDFSHTTDVDVRELLQLAERHLPPAVLV
jgi:putative phosphoribosyl transferase